MTIATMIGLTRQLLVCHHKITRTSMDFKDMALASTTSLTSLQKTDVF